MSDSAEESTPVGERYIRKTPCEVCSSSGIELIQDGSACGECSGLGWITDKTNDVIVCPACKGERCIGVRPRTCGNCMGRGYRVEIVQDFKCSTQCPDCGGKGFAACKTCNGIGNLPCTNCNGTGNKNVKKWNPRDSRLSNCSKCQGIGYQLPPTPIRFGVREWDNSELKIITESRFGKNCLDDMMDNDRILFDARSFLQVVRCKKCLGRPVGSHCFLCNGRRITAVVYTNPLECEFCDGSGLVDGPPACDECGGTGEIECPDCDEAEESVICDLCCAEGFIEKIETRPV